MGRRRLWNRSEYRAVKAIELAGLGASAAWRQAAKAEGRFSV